MTTAKVQLTANQEAELRTMNANGDFLHSLAASLEGQTVLAGGQSGQLRFWSTMDGQLLRELK